MICTSVTDEHQRALLQFASLTTGDGVAVVNSTVNESEYQCMRSIKFQCSAGVSKLVEAFSDIAISVFLHRQIRGKDDAEVANSIKWIEYVDFTNT